LLDLSELHIETIDSELRLVATLRYAARERGWAAAVDRRGDALLDEGRGLAELWNQFARVRV
jgi:hypothetical protein